MKFGITLLLSVCALLVVAAPVPDAETVEIREPQPEAQVGGPATQTWRRSIDGDAPAPERRQLSGFFSPDFRRSIDGDAPAPERRQVSGFYSPDYRRSVEEREPQVGGPATQTWRREAQVGGPTEQTWRREAQVGGPTEQTWRRSIDGDAPAPERRQVSGFYSPDY